MKLNDKVRNDIESKLNWGPLVAQWNYQSVSMKSGSRFVENDLLVCPCAYWFVIRPSMNFSWTRISPCVDTYRRWIFFWKIFHFNCPSPSGGTCWCIYWLNLKVLMEFTPLTNNSAENFCLKKIEKSQHKRGRMFRVIQKTIASPSLVPTIIIAIVIITTNSNGPLLAFTRNFFFF